MNTGVIAMWLSKPCRFVGLLVVRGRVVALLAATVGVLSLWAVALVGSASAALPSECSEAMSLVMCSYSYTGFEQTFGVPAGVQSVDINAVGAPGSSGSLSSPGGVGAVAGATVPLLGGTATLYVEVGGAATPLETCPGVGAGGFNGGASGSCAGGGGGASDVRTVSCGSSCASGGGPDSLASRLVVAGGGGGGSFCTADTIGGTAGDQSASGPGNGGGCSSGGDGGFGGTQGGLGVDGAAPGQLGQGGGGGAGGFDGGGGGGGYYYGGGGGDDGGGGAGSSFWVPGASNTSMSEDTTGTASVTISYSAPGVQTGPSQLTYSTQPESTISSPQTVTVSNTGAGQLVVTGLTFTGTDPQDYLVTSNGCLGPIAAGASCQIGVSFAPQEHGASSASLQIASNDPNTPAIVTLSGTSGQLPQGPTGATGATGVQGPAGPQGARGPAGKIELVLCKTVTTTRKKGRVRKCSTRLVSGVIKFQLGSDDLATVTHRHIVFATGAAVPIGHGRLQLMLTPRRRLRRGRYTLTLHNGHGDRRSLKRTTITIT